MLDTIHADNFDVVRYAWVADYDDASSFLNIFWIGDSKNTIEYSNPAFSEAIRNTTKVNSLEERGKYYQHAEDLLGEDVSAIPVYRYVRTHLVKPQVRGSAPDNRGDYYTKDIYIKKY